MGLASPPEASFMPNSRPQVCKLLPSGFSRQARPPVTFLMSKRVPWRGSRRHIGMLMNRPTAGKARPFVPNAACTRGFYYYTSLPLPFMRRAWIVAPLADGFATALFRRWLRSLAPFWRSNRLGYRSSKAKLARAGHAR